jgi:flagellar basal-body rod modification protein FlgD
MTVGAISQAQNPATSSINRSGTIGDYQTFLRLFTVQLRHQDPSQPLDTNQMTQQLAQFSTVEQAVKQNQNLEKLITAQKQNQVSAAVGLIGSEVETNGNSGELNGNQAVFSYLLPKAAASAKIVITDAAGRAVYQGEGTKIAGRNLVVWDGVNSITGNREPAGTYNISIKAKDNSGKDITVDNRAVGVVTSVESDRDGTVLLAIGGKNVKYSDVLAVRAPVRVVTPGSGNIAADNSGSVGG